jgi:CheY-like chemotaxis protein
MPRVKTQPLRFLVIDDDTDFADSVVELLRTEGVHAEAAYDGGTGVERVRQQPFDVVLLDMRMPGQDGVETLREILRARPALKVVMMTGYCLPARVEEALGGGATAVLAKPLDLQCLRALIAGDLSGFHRTTRQRPPPTIATGSP